MKTATALRDSVRPTPGTVILGRTTYAEVVRRYGRPSNEESDVLDDLVIGYAWSSSHREDSTDFDETRISRLQKGRTRASSSCSIPAPS